MDALDLITEDHERFRSMLDRYEELGDEESAAKRQLIDDLVAAVVRHGTMEEEAFYPFVRSEVPDVEGDIREELEEHHVLELIMVELKQMGAEDPQFDAKVVVFAENLLHHLDEEEEELFPVLREKLDAAVLESLVEDLRAARDRASPEPDPRRVGG